MVTRHCVLCSKDKSVKRFYFARRERRYQKVCRSCLQNGAYSQHTHNWKLIQTRQERDVWVWRYRCMICAVTTRFETSYPPVSKSADTVVKSEKINVLSRGPLAGQTVVVTGSLSTLRDIAVGKLQALGATVRDSVSRNTTMLLCGKRPSLDKMRRAQQYGAQLLKEHEFRLILENTKIWDSKRVSLFEQFEPVAALKQWARYVLSYSVKIGATTRPSTCHRCGASGRIEGHHWDYEQPLNVEWLCKKKCHPQADKERRSREPRKPIERRLRAYKALLKEEQLRGMIRHLPKELLHRL